MKMYFPMVYEFDGVYVCMIKSYWYKYMHMLLRVGTSLNAMVLRNFESEKAEESLSLNCRAHCSSVGAFP